MNSTPSSPVERREVLLRDVVFALAFFEGHEIDPLRRDEPLDGLTKCSTHGRDHHRRRHPTPSCVFTK